MNQKFGSKEACVCILTAALLWEALAGRYAMHGTLNSRLDSIDTRLNTISSSISTLQELLATLTERVSSNEARLSEAENKISTLDDSAGTQQTAVAKLRGELAQLLTKVDDLENWSRRKNLRITGLPEKAEGSDLTKFLREMLPVWLELSADLSLEIERAHRTPTVLSGARTTPQNITVQFLRYIDKDAVLRAAQVKRHVLHNNSTIPIFQGFSAEVMRSRREFEAVKKALAAKHIYRGFAYPAKLRCLYRGRIHLLKLE
ncbi:hypothetical protein AOLI_G00060810 [Acnodon oligacanthus]